MTQGPPALLPSPSPPPASVTFAGRGRLSPRGGRGPRGSHRGLRCCDFLRGLCGPLRGLRGSVLRTAGPGLRGGLSRHGCAGGGHRLQRAGSGLPGAGAYIGRGSPAPSRGSPAVGLGGRQRPGIALGRDVKGPSSITRLALRGQGAGAQARGRHRRVRLDTARHRARGQGRARQLPLWKEPDQAALASAGPLVPRAPQAGVQTAETTFWGSHPALPLPPPPLGPSPATVGAERQGTGRPGWGRGSLRRGPGRGLKPWALCGGWWPGRCGPVTEQMADSRPGARGGEAVGARAPRAARHSSRGFAPPGKRWDQNR